MSGSKEIQHIRKRVAFRAVDGFLKNLNTNRSGFSKFLTIGISVFLYASVLIVFGNQLKVSANYFIVVPLLAVAFSFGLSGGIVSGILALPLNLLMFHLLGHPEYSPESKLIAELTGITIGTVLGYLSDYYSAIESEVERRRAAEKKLQQTVSEKEVLIDEIHHRVKNNLNIVKSLIQFQLDRSESPEFSGEAAKLINRIYSISRVHEKLYSGDKVGFPTLDKYIPQLVDDILKGLGEEELEVKYSIDISDVEVSIEQAASLGLVINEVLTNAVKYSLVLVEFPKLEVALRTESGKTIIDLINNAPTFIPGEDDYKGLGIKLIKTLCKQLGAEYEYLPGNGTTFRLRFPA